MITEREQKFLTYWKKKRETGKWKFAFLHGTLMWALPAYGFMQLFYFLFRDDYQLVAGRFFTGLVVWVIVGFFGFGLLMWWLNERAYDKIKTKNPDA